MKKNVLGVVFLLLLFISGCSMSSSPLSSSSSPSSAPPPSSSSVPPLESSSSMEDTESSSSEEPGPPINLQILSAENLGSDIKDDLQAFEEQQAKSLTPNKEYLYLYVVDENGEPVANLHCFPYGVKWIMRDERDERNGLSRNSGLLPIYAADVADADPVIIYLCNEDTETISYHERPSITQEVEIDKERLEQLKAGGVLQLIWTKEKPIDTLMAVDYITVTVTDSDGRPAANRVVYIHLPASQVGSFPDRGGCLVCGFPL